MCLGETSKEGRELVIGLLEGIFKKVVEKEGMKEELEGSKGCDVVTLYDDVEVVKKWGKGKFYFS